MKMSFLFCVCCGAAWLLALAADGCAASEKKVDKTEEKRIAFEMRTVAWKRVLEWLTDHTGLPIVSKYKPPAGTVSIIVPMNDKGTLAYKTSEIIDLINDQLISEKFLLILRDKSILLACADDKITLDQVPLVDIIDLGKRGRNELVSVALPVQQLGGSEGVKDIRKLLTPFGDAVVLGEMKRVVLIDTASNLRKICKIAEPELPTRPKKDAGTKKEKPAAPPKEESNRFNELEYVYLTEITRSKDRTECVLTNRVSLDRHRLRLTLGHSTLTFVDEDDVKTEIRIRVVRIDARDVYLQAGSALFAVHVGDQLKEALAKPLSAERAKELGLKLEK